MKIGILGYGSIGRRHSANLIGLNHAVSWYDPNEGHHIKAIREDVIHWADAIVVASPSKNHAQDMIDAVNATKHVLVEKPFCYDCPPFLAGYLKGARSKFPNLIVATGFNLRFHDCVRKTKELIHEIGPLKAAMFTVRQKTEKPPYLRDGIIRNWLSHEIDLARYLLGEIDYVDRCDAPIDEHGSDATEALVVTKFKDVQNKVFFEADYFSSPESRYFWIEGEDGAIYVDLVKRNVFIRDKADHHRQVLVATDSWDQNYMDEMKCFIKSIEIGQHQAPLATGEDGIKCLEAVMAARLKAGLLL